MIHEIKQRGHFVVNYTFSHKDLLGFGIKLKTTVGRQWWGD
jgi:hypothetical protein